MQVGIDVMFMYTNFGGRDRFCFGNIATFKNDEISLSDKFDWNQFKKFVQLLIYLLALSLCFTSSFPLIPVVVT